MAHHQEHRLHPIRVLHILGCLAIAGWFSWFAWENHPSRAAFKMQSGLQARRGPKAKVPALALPEKLRVRLGLVRSVLPDAIGGLTVLALFSLGTGVYARRFEIWLEAHRAGEAAALRGLGLDQAALGANRDRKKGASL
jgi:hypothetical protein